MNDLSSLDKLDIENRLQEILARLEVIFADIGPKITEVGHLREEAGFLELELNRRSTHKDGT